MFYIKKLNNKKAEILAVTTLSIFHLLWVLMFNLYNTDVAQTKILVFNLYIFNTTKYFGFKYFFKMNKIKFY